MTGFLTHGRILGGTATTPDIDAALGDYCDRLGLRLVEAGNVPEALARSWDTPGVAGRQHAVLAPESGKPCHLRLIEQPVPEAFRPTRSYGWAAFEITVQDVFGWPTRLDGSGFDIVGPPKEIPGLPYFVAMQMLGRGREMVYLNEVRQDTPTSNLPRAASPVDHLFIVILAAPDREAAMRWYADSLGLEEGSRYTIPYTMINKAFDLPADHMTTLSMAQAGRMPIVEIDDYPGTATERPRDAGMLPPGNAMVTLAVRSLEATGLAFVAPPMLHESAFYGGRRAATAIGAAGELLELIEIG
jgi:catechol 2,3-dioxygenase-like lactoylglutathione lyase family enzyme